MSGVTGKALIVVVLASLAYPGTSSAADSPWYKKLWGKITQKNVVRQTPALDPAKSLPPPVKRPAVQSAKPASKAPAAPSKTHAVTLDEDNAPEAPLSDAARKVLNTPTRESQELKQNPRALTVDDSSPEMQTLTSDGYTGPDMSEERSPADEHLHRNFPMPQPQVQQPMKNPPTIQQYAPPPQPPRRRDE